MFSPNDACDGYEVIQVTNECPVPSSQHVIGLLLCTAQAGGCQYDVAHGTAVACVPTDSDNFGYCSIWLVFALRNYPCGRPYLR